MKKAEQQGDREVILSGRISRGHGMHLGGDARIPCLTNVFSENNFSRVRVNFQEAIGACAPLPGWTPVLRGGTQPTSPAIGRRLLWRQAENLRWQRPQLAFPDWFVLAVSRAHPVAPGLQATTASSGSKGKNAVFPKNLTASSRGTRIHAPAIASCSG
jgi:hypothetical protein